MQRLRVPRVGDVYRARNGVLRIVRHVSVCQNDRALVNERKTWVYFTIRRCSWTRRCYTLYNLAELEYFGYSFTGKRVKGWTDKYQDQIDRVIQAGTQELTCCQVEGIA